MTTTDPHQYSPPWGANVKLIVGLTFVAIVAAFLIRFQTIIAPLLLTLILVYLLRPVVVWLSEKTPLSWRMSVNLIFLVLVVLVLVSSTLTGVAVVQQFESLIGVLQRFLADIPDLILEWSSSAYMIGPFRVDMSRYFSTQNIEALAQELIGIVQPMLGQAGSLLGTVASGTATFFGWFFFIMMVSYFILADMWQAPGNLIYAELPGYDSDFRRLAKEINQTWDAFLRGQVIMFTLSTFTYTLVFTALGVRYALALALVAGLSRFVPYIGQFVTWVVLVLVLFFQRTNYLGLEPLYFLLLVVGAVFIIDSIFDNVVSPRILGQSLGVHPAGVLVAAIIGANLLGIVGVILAAPGLASSTLIVRYIVRKMLDLDPWPNPDEDRQTLEYPWTKLWQRVIALVAAIRLRMKTKK